VGRWWGRGGGSGRSGKPRELDILLFHLAVVVHRFLYSKG
jgi:hypothetical protein